MWIEIFVAHFIIQLTIYLILPMSVFYKKKYLIMLALLALANFSGAWQAQAKAEPVVTYVVHQDKIEELLKTDQNVQPGESQTDKSLPEKSLPEISSGPPAGKLTEPSYVAVVDVNVPPPDLKGLPDIDSGYSGPDYNLGPGDELEIEIYNEDQLSGLYRISGKNTISMPLIGKIDTRNLGPPELETKIEQKLAGGFLVDPSVSIQISKHRPFYILGEVRAPGSYDFKSDINVLNAVALAGGFTYRADKDDVKILRRQEGRKDIYREFSVDAVIKPGDIILVEERFF